MTIAPTSVLEVRDLKKHFPVRRGLFGRQVGTVSPSTASRLRSTPARRSAWLASRVAENLPLAR